VAKGYSQIKGIDYNETFSPVVKISLIRVLLAWAAFRKLTIHQMDVKSAFLNSLLEEDIYMSQPEGYVNSKYKDLVCKLNKTLYGLKQSSRSWYHRMNM
jgi:hypothetical protein